MQNDELSKTIAKLCAEYAAQLPATIARMEDIWRRFIAGELAPAQLNELERMAHSIAGSGETFGLAQASAAARKLERLVEKLIANGHAPEPEDVQRVQALFAALAQASKPG